MSEEQQTKKISDINAKLVKKSSAQKTVFTREGEAIVLTEREERPGDAGFYKVWMSNLLVIANQCSATTLRTFIFLTNLSNSENKIIGTISQLAKKIKIHNKNIGRVSLSKSIQELIEVEAIVKINQGAYMINPNTFYRGYADKRSYLKYEFDKLKEQDQKDSEKEKSANQTPLPKGE